MKITIGDLEQELNFGFGFIEEANRKWNRSDNGIEVNLGVAYTQLAMQTGDIEKLLNIVYFATSENSPRASREDVIEYIQGLSIKSMEKLFDEIEKELEKSAPVHFAVKKMQDTAKKAQQNEASKMITKKS